MIKNQINIGCFLLAINFKKMLNINIYILDMVINYINK